MPKPDTPKITNAIKLEDLAAAWTKLGYHRTTRSYRQVADEGKAPAPVRGYVDALKSLILLLVYEQALAKGSGSLSLTDERTRLTRINADQKQFNLELARGDVINTRKAQSLWSSVMENIVGKIDAITSKLAPMAFGRTIPEIKSLTERMVYEVKSEIANPDLAAIARMGSHKRTTEPTAAKTAAHRKRVGRSKTNTKPRGKRGAGTVVHGQS